MLRVLLLLLGALAVLASPALARPSGFRLVERESLVDVESTVDTILAVLAPPPPPPAATKSAKIAPPSDWSYLTCLPSHFDGARVLPHFLDTPQWSVDACTAAASAAGYTYAGAIGGGECWASTSLPSTAPHLSEAACGTWTCLDDQSRTCGGMESYEVYVSGGAQGAEAVAEEVGAGVGADAEGQVVFGRRR
ncbi:hypothetical protein JCM8097_007981 [Rhodosporidiobolus ruineniae]